jgi:predicted transcriptional regulator
VWIYETAPESALKGYARLDGIVSGKPSFIWETLGPKAGLSKADFDSYFDNRVAAHALVLSGVRLLREPLPLKQMKKMVQGFHPPQFFCHLNGAATEMRLATRSSHVIVG